jgi:uncharacterized membrane protein
MLTCGAAGGLLAAVAGFVDWWAIPKGTRAYRVGVVHLIVNLVAIVLFGVSWIDRVAVGPANAGTLPFGLAIAAFAFLLVGGWFGGELVERLGVGVARGAQLDAPSSLKSVRPRAHRPPNEPQPA